MSTMTNLKWAAAVALIAVASGTERPEYCDPVGSFTTDMTQDPLPCRFSPPDIEKLRWVYFNERNGDEWVSLPNANPRKVKLDPTSEKHTGVAGTYGTVAGSLAAAWDPLSPTKVLIKGFGEDPKFTRHGGILVKEYLKKYRGQGLNVLLVDTSDGLFASDASFDLTGGLSKYPDASRNTQVVGWQVAKLFEALSEQGKIKVEGNAWDIHCVGHSLGAQTCARFGRSLQALTGKPIARITALDAAHPRFSVKTESSNADDELAQFSIHKDAAKHVDCVHTNGNLDGERKLLWYNVGSVLQYQGLASPCGHADYYINGGFVQPGCPLYASDALTSGLVACSHKFAPKFWAAVINNPMYEIDRCDTLDAANPTTEEYESCTCFPSECHEPDRVNRRDRVTGVFSVDGTNPIGIFGEDMPARNGLFYVYTSGDQASHYAPEARDSETGLVVQQEQEFDNFNNWQAPGVQLGIPGRLGFIRGSFTAMAWVQRHQKRLSGNIFEHTDYTVFGASGGSANDEAMRLIVRGGQYAMVWGNTQGGPLHECHTTPEEGVEANPRNLWTHVAFVYEKEHHEAKIYVDGRLGVTCTGMEPWDVTSTDATARLGYWEPNQRTSWKGYIKSTKIYNKALPADTIMALKGPCTGTHCPEVVDAVWDRCNQNSDPVVTRAELQFCAADTNGDGRVDTADVQGRRLDLNGDGETTLMEIAFANADVDDSGALNKEEFTEVLFEMPEMITANDIEMAENASESTPLSILEPPTLVLLPTPSPTPATTAVRVPAASPTPSEPEPTPTSQPALLMSCSDYTTKEMCQAAGATGIRRRLKMATQCMWKEKTGARRRLNTGSCVEKPKACSDYTTKEMCQAAGAAGSRRRLKVATQCMWKEATGERRRLKTGSCVEKPKACSAYTTKGMCQAAGAIGSRRRLKAKTQCMWKETTGERRRLKTGFCVDKSGALQPQTDRGLKSRVNAVVALVTINTVFLVGVLIYVVIKQ